MEKYVADYTYTESEGLKLFTAVLLPDAEGKFPVIIMRSPYVDRYENEEEKNIAVEYLNEHKNWLKNLVWTKYRLLQLICLMDILVLPAMLSIIAAV